MTPAPALLKKIRPFPLALFALAAALTPAWAGPAGIVDQLQPGDRVEISVFQEEKLSGNYELDSSGQITFPLAGQLTAAGKSPLEFKRILTEALRVYIIHPEVTVTRLSSGKNISILGRVKNQGAFDYTTGLTLMRLISQAGGFDTSADKKKIRIVRMVEGQKQIVYVNASAIINGQEDDPPIQPGDMVFVPESVF